MLVVIPTSSLDSFWIAVGFSESEIGGEGTEGGIVCFENVTVLLGENQRAKAYKYRI